jgi:hypothetical protein
LRTKEPLSEKASFWAYITKEHLKHKVWDYKEKTDGKDPYYSKMCRNRFCAMYSEFFQKFRPRAMQLVSPQYAADLAAGNVINGTSKIWDGNFYLKGCEGLVHFNFDATQCQEYVDTYAFCNCFISGGV